MKINDQIEGNGHEEENTTIVDGTKTYLQETRATLHMDAGD